MSVEYSDGEFTGAQVLPDVFHRVEFRCIGRQFQQRDVIARHKTEHLMRCSVCIGLQLQQRDVIRHPKVLCVMPSRSIHDQQSTGHARRWPRFWRSLRGAIPSLRYWRMARLALRLFRVPDRPPRRYSSICSAYREGRTGVSRALHKCGSAPLVNQDFPTI